MKGKSHIRNIVPVVVVQHTQPTKDNHHYWFGEQIKKAFGDLFENFYGEIHIHPITSSTGGVTITLKNDGVLTCFDASEDFEFLATSQFTYRRNDAEPWQLEITPLKDGFGLEMSVKGRTARACVKGMISERKKFLREQLSRLTRRSRPFEDYTRMHHVYG